MDPNKAKALLKRPKPFQEKDDDDEDEDEGGGKPKPKKGKNPFGGKQAKPFGGGGPPGGGGGKKQPPPQHPPQQQHHDEDDDEDEDEDEDDMPHGGGEDHHAGGDEDDEDGGEGGEHEEGGGGEPGWAAEMEHWLDDLEAEYPGIREHVEDLEHELEEGDIQSSKEALEDLLEFMSDEMNTAYPELDEAEKHKVSQLISEHMKHKDHPGGAKQAVAIGLRQAAPGKYAKYEKDRSSGK